MTARQNYVAMVRASRALRALMADPEDSSRVFEIVEALRPKHKAPMLQRLREHPDGAQLLASRPAIREALGDRACLLAMPEGSLGRAYLSYLDSSGISAEGLVAASQIERTEWSEEGTWMSERMRDTHDLWHTVTGYGSDVAGEMLVLAFSFAQTKTPGLGLIVLASLLANVGTPMGADITLAYVRGLSADWLPAVAWESLLDQPIAEVRAQLKVGEPLRYQPIDLATLSDTSIVRRVLHGHKNAGTAALQRAGADAGAAALPSMRKESPPTQQEERSLRLWGMAIRRAPQLGTLALGSP